MPTSKKAKQILLSLIEKGVVYELGSGWGALSIAISQKTSVRAFEKALIPWFFSLLYKMTKRAKNLSIERRDLFSVELFDADVIICYLYPKAMQRLEIKFEKELKKGALVLSNSFQLPKRKPDLIIETGDWMRSKIYCYKY